MSRLSPREIEVLQHLAYRDDAEWVGAQLGISPYTVKQHLRKIARKIRTETRMDAVMWAIRQGLITTERKPRS